MGLASDIVIVVVAALVGGIIAHRVGLPPLVGYIIAGVAVGPHAGIVLVSSPEAVDRLAEIGAALLLFALGLELSLTDLRAVRGVAIGGASIQVVLTALVGIALARGLGWPPVEAMWFGAIASLSSTIVAMKTLSATGRIGTLSARVIVGMALVQDLAIVPIMAFLPQVGRSVAGADVLLATLRATALLAVLALFGIWGLPRILHRVSRWNSRELSLLTLAAIGLGAGYLTWAVGLSFAIGAFVAGLVLSESDYSYQALSDITSVRDLFGVLFFASIGMLLDPAFLAANAGTVALVVGVIMTAKATIFACVTRAFGYRFVVPLAVGFALAQIGEFSFVIAQAGLRLGALRNEVYAVAIATAVVSMLLTPPLMRSVAPIYGWWRRRQPREAPSTFNLPVSPLQHHVVVAGGGRIGEYVARVLAARGEQFVVIELDQHRVARLRAQGVALVYGDASQVIVLEAAGIPRAQLLLVTTPSEEVTRGVFDTARRMQPGLRVVARAETREQIEALRDLGLYEIVQPQFEAALEMSRQALLHLGAAPDEVERLTDEARRELHPARPDDDSPDP
jgi:CPA2 family monovalent cation:H+ antiporter-2